MQERGATFHVQDPQKDPVFREGVQVPHRGAAHGQACPRRPVPHGPRERDRRARSLHLRGLECRRGLGRVHLHGHRQDHHAAFAAAGGRQPAGRDWPAGHPHRDGARQVGGHRRRRGPGHCVPCRAPVRGGRQRGARHHGRPHQRPAAARGPVPHDLRRRAPAYHHRRRLLRRAGRGHRAARAPAADATKVDWNDLSLRQASYRTEEGQALKAYEEANCACQK